MDSQEDTPEERPPREELEELVEYWREMAEKIGPKEFEIAYDSAADDLEEVLNG